MARVCEVHPSSVYKMVQIMEKTAIPTSANQIQQDPLYAIKSLRKELVIKHEKQSFYAPLNTWDMQWNGKILWEQLLNRRMKKTRDWMRRGLQGVPEQRARGAMSWCIHKTVVLAMAVNDTRRSKLQAYWDMLSLRVCECNSLFISWTFSHRRGTNDSIPLSQR